MMHWQIGQSYPIEGTGILGDILVDKHGNPTPAWFIFRNPPMKEKAAQAWLMRQGALEAWYPTTVDWVPAKGANPRRRKVAVERRVAPGYIFAYVDREPRWHFLFEAARGRVSRVVSWPDGRPMALSDRVIAAMQHVPRRIQALHEKQEAERLAEILARQPVVGEEASIVGDHLLSGHTVSVTDIHGGLAQCLAWGFTKMTIPVDKLERKK